MDEYRGEFGLLGTPEQWELARADNEWRRAEERRRAAEDAENAAKLQDDLDRIDAMAWYFLKDELIAEKGTTRVTPQQQKDFRAYREYTQHFGWPHDTPQALFAFLAHDLSRPARVRRLHNSIRAVIHSTGLTDVTHDPIICALMRRRADKSNPLPQKKGN
jgi:hypothetical protein